MKPDLPYSDDPGRTHYHGCWRERGHHNCAVREVERLLLLIADGYDGSPAWCKYCGKSQIWTQDEFTPAGYTCIHCGHASSGTLLMAYRLCTWRGPDGETCPAPWQTERTGQKLCSHHASIVELAREPLREGEP